MDKMFYSQSWQQDSKVCVFRSWRLTIVMSLIVINSLSPAKNVRTF